MSWRIYGPRFAVLAITLALAGAALYLFVRVYLGWWWDGFSLALLGMVLGQSVGIAVTLRVPRWRHSDASAVLGNAVGILVMVSIWLYLSEDAVRVLGHVARALVVGFLGVLLAVVTRPYPDRGQLPRCDLEGAGQDHPSDH
jgi:hypothetical protein